MPVAEQIVLKTRSSLTRGRIASTTSVRRRSDCVVCTTMPMRRDGKPLGQLERRGDHDGLAAGVSHDALDLGVIGLADDDDQVAAAHELLGGLVGLADVRAGGVDHVEPSRARVVDDGRVDAVRPDDERAAVDLVEVLGDHDAALA